MASDGDLRYAPPGANVADVALPQELALASRWRRLFGVTIDSFVLFIPGMLIGVVIGATMGSKFNPSSAKWFGFNLFGLFGVVLFLLFNSYLLVTRGQTIGKYAVGVRIVRPDGSKVSGPRVLGLRYGVGFFLNMIPILGYLYGTIDCLLIFRQSRRCLHDEIADTIVVRV
jgi:uncharacterized RDD family membrane protein YckC